MLDTLNIHNNQYSMLDVDKSKLQDWIQECYRKFPRHKKYKVIYADPPWPYQVHFQNLQGATPYPSMSMEDLYKLPVPEIAEDDCALFLWCTNPMMPKALMLMEAWGFEYKTVFKMWLKRFSNGNPVCNPGWWSRSSTEMLLVGTKGSGILKNKTTHSEPQEYESVRGNHSSKPMELTERVRDFLEVDSRIELFCRKPCDGFDSWGLEVNGFFQEDCWSVSRTSLDVSDARGPIQVCHRGVQVDMGKQPVARKKSRKNDDERGANPKIKRKSGVFDNEGDTATDQLVKQAKTVPPEHDIRTQHLNEKRKQQEMQAKAEAARKLKSLEDAWNGVCIIKPKSKSEDYHKPDCMCIVCKQRRSKLELSKLAAA